jgi:hypothetical protein
MRLRRSSCLGKHKHKSKGAALAHIRHRVSQGLPPGRPYPCVFCKRWHVTTKKGA